MCMGGLCFLLPMTPPTDGVSTGWRAALGLTAFELLKVRDLRVFYVASMLFAIPCVSFYMTVPIMLRHYGSLHPSAQMTMGQVTEIVAMIFLSVVAGRYSIRWFVLAGLAIGILRFVFFALAGEYGVLAVIWFGIALHGPIYTFTTVAGRIFLDKRVPQTMRGQAQALYQLLVGSVAGVTGAFFCEWLYRMQISNSLQSWSSYWWVLAAIASLPMLYFLIGIIGQQQTK